MILLGAVLCGLPCSIYNYSKSKSLGDKPSNWASESSIHEEEDPIWQGILFFLYFLLMIFCIIIFHRFIRNKIVDIDSLNITPSDFTVIVKGLSTDTDYEDLKKFLQENSAPFKQYAEVVAISPSYNISEYVAKTKRLRKMKAMVTQIEMNKNSRMFRKEKKKEELNRKIEEIGKWKHEFENSDNLKFEQGTSAFVTFRKQTEAKEIIDYWRQTELETFSRYLTLCLHKYLFSRRTYQGNVIKIEQAPEPSDIIWENLNVSNWVKFVKKAKTFVVTLILIGISFVVVLSIKIYEYNVYVESGKKHISNSENVKIKMISFFLSASIVILNQIIGIGIRYFSRYEKPSTWTNYNISVFHKLVVSTTLNTIGLLTIVNSYDIQKGYTGANGLDIHWFSNDYGLPTDLSNLLLIDAFVLPLILIYHPKYLAKLYKRKKVRDGKLNITQFEANQLWTNPEIDVAERSARYVRTFMVILFFSPIFPLGLILGIACFLILYWTDKYLLLRRYCRPKTYGKDMTLAVVKWLPISLLAFTISNLAVQYFTHKNSRKFIIAPFMGLIISICYFLFPFRKCCGKKINAEDAVAFNVTQEENDFKKQNLNFHDDYIRSNPVTSKAGWSDWLAEVENSKGLDARNQYQLMYEKTINRAGVFNYADSRPSSNYLNEISGYAYVDPSRYSSGSEMYERYSVMMAKRPESGSKQAGYEYVPPTVGSQNNPVIGSRNNQGLYPPGHQGIHPSYQQPSPSYQQPSPSYQQPSPSYQQPSPSYQQPPPSYQQPSPYQQPPSYPNPVYPPHQGYPNPGYVPNPGNPLDPGYRVNQGIYQPPHPVYPPANPNLHAFNQYYK